MRIEYDLIWIFIIRLIISDRRIDLLEAIGSEFQTWCRNRSVWPCLDIFIFAHCFPVTVFCFFLKLEPCVCKRSCSVTIIFDQPCRRCFFFVCLFDIHYDSPVFFLAFWCWGIFADIYPHLGTVQLIADRCFNFLKVIIAPGQTCDRELTIFICCEFTPGTSAFEILVILISVNCCSLCFMKHEHCTFYALHCFIVWILLG